MKVDMELMPAYGPYAHLNSASRIGFDNGKWFIIAKTGLKNTYKTKEILRYKLHNEFNYVLAESMVRTLDNMIN